MERPIKILFLASNPKDISQLRLDEEMRGIDQALRQAEFRDKFDIKQQWAVRVVDLQSYLLRHKPDIVHFGGHGSVSSEIILEDNDGNSKPVSSRALSQLFSVLKDNIRCVVLNACYSEQQAQAIAQHIDCVIGMSKAIGDLAAISFAVAFYQAVGYGRDVKTAFDLGCVQIDLESLSEQDTPKLLAINSKPNDIVLVNNKLVVPNKHPAVNASPAIKSSKLKPIRKKTSYKSVLSDFIARINAKQAIIVAALSALSGIIGTLIGTGHFKALLHRQEPEEKTNIEQLIPSDESQIVGSSRNAQIIIEGNAISYDVSAWGVLYFNDEVLNGLSSWLKNNELPSAASAEEHYTRGRAFHQFYNFQQAAAEYREALMIQPTYLEAQYMLARALMELRSHDEAIEKFETVLKHDMNNIGAWYYIGVCWMWKGHYERAKDYFQKVIELRPETLGAYYNLGVCHLYSKDYEGGLQAFDYVLRKAPIFVRAHFNKGLTLFHLGKKEDALKSFKLALILDKRFRLQLLENKEHHNIFRDKEIGKRLQELLSEEYGK